MLNEEILYFTTTVLIAVVNMQVGRSWRVSSVAAPRPLHYQKREPPGTHGIKKWSIFLVGIKRKKIFSMKKEQRGYLESVKNKSAEKNSIFSLLKVNIQLWSFPLWSSRTNAASWATVDRPGSFIIFIHIFVHLVIQSPFTNHLSKIIYQRPVIFQAQVMMKNKFFSWKKSSLLEGGINK